MRREDPQAPRMVVHTPNGPQGRGGVLESGSQSGSLGTRVASLAK